MLSLAPTARQKELHTKVSGKGPPNPQDKQTMLWTEKERKPKGDFQIPVLRAFVTG
jgi:hypothetical protein